MSALKFLFVLCVLLGMLLGFVGYRPKTPGWLVWVGRVFPFIFMPCLILLAILFGIGMSLLNSIALVIAVAGMALVYSSEDADAFIKYTGPHSVRGYVILCVMYLLHLLWVMPEYIDIRERVQAIFVQTITTAHGMYMLFLFIMAVSIAIGVYFEWQSVKQKMLKGKKDVGAKEFFIFVAVCVFVLLCGLTVEPIFPWLVTLVESW